MTTENTSPAAQFDAHCIRVDMHIAAICDLAEAWVSTPDDDKDLDTPAAITEHEGALKALGLTQADIYSFVNRAAVPADVVSLTSTTV